MRKRSFEDEAYRVVLSDKRFMFTYSSATHWGGNVAFGESDDKISDAIDSLTAYRGVVDARSKEGRPIVEGIVSRWADALFTNDHKTATIKD